MTRIFLFSLLLLALAACQTPATDAADAATPEATASSASTGMQPSSSVADATRQAWATFLSSDADGIRATFADTDALVLIGSDPTEYLSGYAQATDLTIQQSAALTGATIEPGQIDAYEQGDIGWSASRPTFRFADGTELPGRLTAVFTRDDGNWRIVQWHFSVGVGNEDTAGFEDLPAQ